MLLAEFRLLLFRHLLPNAPNDARDNAVVALDARRADLGAFVLPEYDESIERS